MSEADLEALDGWYDLEDDFELLSFKAWNAVIYQVCTLPPQFNAFRLIHTFPVIITHIHVVDDVNEHTGIA